MRSTLRFAVVAALVCAAPVSARAQYAADVASKDAIIAALYDVISGPTGQARNWDRFYALMHPSARLMAIGRVNADSVALRVMTPKEYAERSGPQLVAIGFQEKETGRHEIRYGNMLHVATAYESTRQSPQPGPAGRGVNSVQLMFDGKRWWILSVYWDSTNPTNETWPPAWVSGR
jgi:hypothetical protein